MIAQGIEGGTHNPKAATGHFRGTVLNWADLTRIHPNLEGFRIPLKVVQLAQIQNITRSLEVLRKLPNFS